MVLVNFPPDPWGDCKRNCYNAAAGFAVNNEQLVSHGSLSKIPNWKGRKTNNQIRKKRIFGTGALRVDWAVRQSLGSGSELSQSAPTQIGGEKQSGETALCWGCVQVEGSKAAQCLLHSFQPLVLFPVGTEHNLPPQPLHNCELHRISLSLWSCRSDKPHFRAVFFCSRLCCAALCALLAAL